MPKMVNHNERREIIANVAARCFAWQGLEATSMQQIANAASIAIGVHSLYSKSCYDVDTVVNPFMKIFLEGIQRKD